MKVFDASVESSALFDVDFGVDCPEKFEIMFRIPTEGPPHIDKRLIVRHASIVLE